MQHKGYTMEPWIHDQVINDFNTIGMADERISIKNDQEPALVDLVREIARVRPGVGAALYESRVGTATQTPGLKWPYRKSRPWSEPSGQL